MKVYYTIGEISKLSNISIKKLRYYDKIDLLKPAYVSTESKYRYYSFNQLITIDLIKQFRTMGFSLDMIKNFLNSSSSIGDIFENIKEQSNLIEQKIKDLNKIKTYLDNLNLDIIESVNIGFNKVFLKHNKERPYINYDIKSNNVDELDFNMREILLDMEKNYGDLYITLGSTVSYEDYKENNKIIYNGFKIFDINLNEDSDNISYLPEGDYLTLVYQGDIRESGSCYKILLDYINKNNIEVSGDFNETWIISKVDENSKEKSLIKIDILIK